jgi:hypothetical protein
MLHEAELTTILPSVKSSLNTHSQRRRHEAENSNTGGQTRILKYGSVKLQVKMRAGMMDESRRCWGGGGEQVSALLFDTIAVSTFRKSVLYK